MSRAEGKRPAWRARRSCSTAARSQGASCSACSGIGPGLASSDGSMPLTLLQLAGRCRQQIRQCREGLGEHALGLDAGVQHPDALGLACGNLAVTLANTREERLSLLLETVHSPAART